jgi:hypothetical protein
MRTFDRKQEEDIVNLYYKPTIKTKYYEKV